MQVDFVFQLAVLIMSVVVHEVSHGYAALYLGDPTAKLQDRLTLNPVKHLDFLGSFIVPLISSMGGFMFGWAKPVPYNPYNLRPGRWSEAMVAGAGPLSNIVIALFFSILLRLDIFSSPSFFDITIVIIFINILLAIFNLMPVPPLDGSKILLAIFPNTLDRWMGYMQHYGLIFVLLFIFFIWPLLSPLVSIIFRIFTGISL